MKQFFILLLFPLKLFSQDITGLWMGSIFNDTTQLTLFYEVAIGESNGKYTAYSYTTFIVNNEPATGVKSLKIVKQNDHFFFEDIELLYNNYPVAPPKGVKQISSLSFADNANGGELSGKFITTRSRQYGRQVTGTVNLQRKTAYDNDKMIAQLEKLNLLNTLSFYKPLLPKKDTLEQSREKSIVRKEAFSNKKNKEKEKEPIVQKPINQLEEVRKREIKTIETVLFSADSLRLVLYDNGYVDGDSVSIILNGKILMEHQRLSEQAITKTISSTADSLKIIMYAENLGSIAPNTGLLIIYDGEIRHEIRFEGDLQNNAAILLKREKKH